MQNIFLIFTHHKIKDNLGDYMSIWNLNEKKRNIKELKENKLVDVLIIGAGITGLTTAYFLKNNKSMCVVDANLIGHGVTLSSTAKINYFQQDVYSKIIKSTNYDNAVKYLKSQRDAISYLKNIILKENIDCDLKQVSSYVFANSNDEVEKLEDEVNFLKENGINVVKGALPIKTKIYKAYYVEDTYTFNPIKYLYELYNLLSKENVDIYENSKIINIEKQNGKYVCTGDNFKIIANKVVLACHYPFFLFPFLMPVRCSIEKSYMIVSEVEKDLDFTCISISNPVYSCRYYQDKNKIYQISLAKSHDIGNHQDDSYYFDRVKEIFGLKEENIIMKYSNSDIITPDYMPYIGELKTNLYIGVGYNTWGMTNGVLAAKIISDEILNKVNEFKEVFKPNRVNGCVILKTPYYIFNNAKSFIGSKLVKNKAWYSNKVSFFKHDGKSLACYKDEAGVNHIVHNKCPHLGCSLIFNETEKTWDCPCHSSRFDIDGKCIKGPSKYDISYKK